MIVPADIPILALKRAKKFYGPIGRLAYAIIVFLTVDGPTGRYTHDALTRKGSWPAPTWTVAVFFLTLLIYATMRRFLDIGLRPWIAIPYSILTFCPYLLLFHSHTMSFWIPTLSALILQSPAMILKGRDSDMT
ncbi:MAG: hypothetical protein WCD47_05255 [Candidatus Sulfotelmatobacter sp.]